MTTKNALIGRVVVWKKGDGEHHGTIVAVAKGDTGFQLLVIEGNKLRQLSTHEVTLEDDGTEMGRAMAREILGAS